MGWRGTLRSINSSLKAMEREAQRRQRELSRQQAAANKAADAESAAYEVEVYLNRLEVLTSVHKEHSERIDWPQLDSLPEPRPPLAKTLNEELAKSEFVQYRPGLFTRVLGREAKKRLQLEQAISTARDLDAAQSAAEMNEFENKLADWSRTTTLASEVLKGNVTSMIEAIREMDPFSDISELGSSVTFSTVDDSGISAVVHVNGESVVPKEVKSQLRSGKLSVKAMRQGQYHELYQDYVCGCVLRVGTELLALLPVDAVLVTAVTPMLNTSTGHKEEQAILSTFLPRATVEGMNLDQVDPSDSIANFSNRMAFKRTKGFAPVEPLTFSDFDAR